MDHLLELAAALLFWRMVVALVASLIIGLVLALLIPSLGGAAVVACLVFGATAGILWQTRALPVGQAAPVESISKPVAFLGLAFVGAVWGGLGTFAFGSVTIPLVVLALAPIVFGPLISGLVGRKLSLRQLLLGSCALTVGLLVPFAIHSASAGVPSNWSVDADPHQHKAASPQSVAGRSPSRYAA